MALAESSLMQAKVKAWMLQLVYGVVLQYVLGAHAPNTRLPSEPQIRRLHLNRARSR